MSPNLRFALPGMLLVLMSACAGLKTAAAPPVKGAVLRGLAVGHRHRTYWLYAPRTTARARPLLIVLHGAGSDGAGMITLGRFAAKADAEGFILAAPNVLDRQNGKAGDVAFIAAVIRAVRARYSVSAVFAAGFGAGGTLAQRLALQLPGSIEGVAAVAGNWRPPAHRMPHARAVPLMLMFGTADPMNPAAGGKVHLADGKVIDVPSPMATAHRWASLYHCSTSLAASVQMIRQTGWYGCDDNVPLTLLSIEGLGHYWPGGAAAHDAARAKTRGPYISSLKATDVIWKFFAHLERRATH